MALKQIYGEGLTWKKVEDNIKNFTDPNTANNDRNESRINLKLTSTSYFFYERTTTSGKLIEFGLRTFQEYLLAEYYIESLLQKDNKLYKLNVRLPSKATIDFLDGLTDSSSESKKRKHRGIY